MLTPIGSLQEIIVKFYTLFNICVAFDDLSWNPPWRPNCICSYLCWRKDSQADLAFSMFLPTSCNLALTTSQHAWYFSLIDSLAHHSQKCSKSLQPTSFQFFLLDLRAALTSLNVLGQLRRPVIIFTFFFFFLLHSFIVSEMERDRLV